VVNMLMKQVIHQDIHLPRRKTTRKNVLVFNFKIYLTARCLLIVHHRSPCARNVSNVKRNCASPIHSGRLECA